jgi:hypothetical protein
MTELRSGQGRPKKAQSSDESKQAKKGRRSWKPVHADEVFKKDPKYVYRKVAKDEHRVARMLAEGWEFVTRNNAYGTEMENLNVNSGKPLSNNIEGVDNVLMRLPSDMAKQRNAYYQKLSRERMDSINLKKEAQDGVDVGSDVITGEINIDNVIK